MMQQFKYILAIIAGAIAALWVALHPLMQLLFLLSICDVISGWAAAYINATVSSDLSFRGMVKKSMMFLCVGMGAMVGRFAAGADHSLIVIGGVSVSLGAGLAGAFCLTEATSIVENLSRAGVPMPPFVTTKLTALREDVWSKKKKPDESDQVDRLPPL